MAHTLYRMFDRDGVLLYVGISKRPMTRFDEHGRAKPWWQDVERITVEHFPSRPALEVAERMAIRAEAPLHNKQRYGATANATPIVRGGHGYSFTSIYGHTRTGAGLLMWEVCNDPISDDYLPSEISAGELFVLWLARVTPHVDPMGYVPIYWYVDGPGLFESVDTYERSGRRHDGGYSSYYLPPVDLASGQPVGLAALPVADKLWHGSRADKGGFIQEATGWKPAPLQDSVPIRLLQQLAMARAGITC